MQGHPRPWGERILPGSWRAVPFFVVSHSVDGGRRLAVHELPQRDDALVEDMGRRQRRFQVEMLGIGPDYFYWRDELREALEEAGPGTLVHPWLGEIRCCVESFTISETTSEGGQFRVRVTFLEATSDLRVVTEVDYAGQARAAAAEVEAALPEVFASMVVGEDLGTPLARLVGEIEAVVRCVEGEQAAVAECLAKVTALAGQLQTLAASPAQAAATVISAIQGAASLLSADGTGMATGAMARAASGIGDTWPDPAAGRLDVSTPWLPDPASTAQLAAAQDQRAVLILTRAAFAAAIVTVALEVDFAVADDALAAAKHVDALIEGAVAEVTVPCAMRLALTALRDASERYLRHTIADLPRRLRYTPLTTTPAIVIAQRIYGDATRAAEIERLNGLSHPLFATGGQALEVLSD